MGRQWEGTVFDELQTHAVQHQQALRREAEISRLIRHAGIRRSIRIVPPILPRRAAIAASVFASAGTLRLER